MTYSKYKEIVKKNTPKKSIVKNSFFAFLSGGLIGVFGEMFFNIALNVFRFPKDEASFFSCMSLVIVAFILTLTASYNKVSQICGAGLFLPTTGFANSLTSASLERRNEGLIQGIGSNIFSLAGSVIAYGILSAWYFATIYYFLNLWGINIWA